MGQASDPQFNKWNEYLLTELAASETYKEAAEKVQDELVREQLEQCERSHRNRAQKLQYELQLQDLRLDSDIQPQVWNSFAALMADGRFKDKDAVQLLEEEEELGLQTYKDDSAQLGEQDPLKYLLQNVLLPEQSTTHDALNILRLSLP